MAYKFFEDETSWLSEGKWETIIKRVEWIDSIEIQYEDDEYYYSYEKLPIGVFYYRFSKKYYKEQKPPGNIYIYWVNLRRLQIRKGPGENYEKIGTLHSSKPIYVFLDTNVKLSDDELPDWVKIPIGDWTDSSSVGWVLSKFLSNSKTLAEEKARERDKRKEEKLKDKDEILTPEDKKEIKTIFEKAISVGETRDEKMIIRDCKYFYDLLFVEDTTLPSYYSKGDWLFSYFTDLLDSASNEASVRLGLDWNYYNWNIAEIHAVHPSEVVGQSIIKILTQNPSLIKKLLTDPLQRNKKEISFSEMEEYVNYYFNGNINKAIKETKEPSILYGLWNLYDWKLFSFGTQINIRIPLLNESRDLIAAKNNIIPVEYTCKGEEISPEVKWSEIPENTESMVILFEDIETRKFHWILYNIPPELSSIEENFNKSATSESKIIQGLNDFGKIGYSCPCEFIGNRNYHAYYLIIYALDIELEPIKGLTVEELYKRIVGHVIAKGRKICFYVKDITY